VPLAHPKTFRVAHQKPATCQGCPLYERGTGFVPAEGDHLAPLLFVGEIPGYDEAATGRPFVGAAGSMLERLFRQVGIDRAQVRIANTAQCTPPKLWFDSRAPWYRGALEHCRQYVDPVLHEPHQVIVPMGATAIRHLLGVHGKHTGPEAFHGTVTRLGDQWVVPTYHPSHLQRGAMPLFGTVSWDLARALDVVRHGWQPDPLVLVEDPPLDWFQQWVDQVIAAIREDPYGVWVAVDIETPDTHGRDEDTLGEDDRSYVIERVNVSAHPDEGVTVPYGGGYIPILHRLLGAITVAVMWYGDYDKPRLAKRGHPIPPVVHDGMWMWKMLQSDLPGGLAFVAPFYSRYGAWKHLAKSDPVTYAAIDGPQELRSAFGMATDLMQQGQWEAYERHQRRLDQYVLKPASAVGVPVDRPRLLAFKADLTAKARRLLHALQGQVPDSLRPLTPKDGLAHPPAAGAVHTKGRATTVRGAVKKDRPDELKQDLYAQSAQVVEKLVLRTIKVCHACGAQDVQSRHRCQDKALTPYVLPTVATVSRWFWQEPFNPDSPLQILQWMKHHKHPVGRSKTTDESTDRQTLEANLARTKHPFYRTLLDYRAVKKVESTYVEGTLRRLDKDDRLHPRFTFKPSTQRLSAAAPNIQNVIADRDNAKKGLADGFRRCVVAPSSSRLLEIDFSGVEAVLVGWFARDPSYIRLAKLGVHSGLASHILGDPYDPGQLATDPEAVRAFLKTVKQRALQKAVGKASLYDASKRVVHGVAYCLTPNGMVRNYPELFQTVAAAQKYHDIYLAMAPSIPRWQKQVQQFAYDHGYLGGPGEPPFGHPFGYKHWFFALSKLRPLSSRAVPRREAAGEPVVWIHGKPYAPELGEDAKRGVAFYPQSTGSGLLKEAMLRLFDPEEAEPYRSYLGAVDGVTVLRAPIHDSLFLEVPLRHWDRVLETAVREMTRPCAQLPCPPGWGLGDCLAVDVEVKAGQDWSAMATVGDRPAAETAPFTAALGEEDEDVADLQVVA
jgi:uracil-DNA glycosylase family 4